MKRLFMYSNIGRRRARRHKVEFEFIAIFVTVSCFLSFAGRISEDMGGYGKNCMDKSDYSPSLLYLPRYPKCHRDTPIEWTNPDLLS